MGIRFHCPNGHRLNVKSFLAGKRGICPKCKVKLIIPNVSEPEFQDHIGEAEPHESVHVNSDSDSGDTAVLRSSKARKTKPVSVGEEEAHWYLCPPSGGQYGPVNTVTMDQWIDDGRVTSDSLVWRNGWPDWQTAGKVFPTIPKPKQMTASSAVATETPQLLESSSATVSRRRKGERTTMTAVVLLLLAAILLGGALILATT